jgi:hypothetical protein
VPAAVNLSLPHTTSILLTRTKVYGYKVHVHSHTPLFNSVFMAGTNLSCILIIIIIIHCQCFPIVLLTKLQNKHTVCHNRIVSFNARHPDVFLIIIIIIYDI